MNELEFVRESGYIERMKFLNQALAHPKTTNHHSQKEYVALLDELAALTVKARDKFQCRDLNCRRHWLPVMIPSGRVIVAEDCHWAHIFPRARGLALRHELDNGLTLCFRHHKAFDAMTETEKFESVIENGLREEVYFDLQKRSRDIVTAMEGSKRASALLLALREQLFDCQAKDVSLELEIEKVLKFYEMKSR